MLKKVFVVSPLSLDMVEKVVNKYNIKFEQITCGFLKNLGVLSTIKFLRSIKEMTVIFEDKESEKLKYIFLVMFLFTKSKKINFITEDLSFLSSEKRNALFALIASVFSLGIAFYCAIKLFILSKIIRPYRPTPLNNNIKDILYLKSNYWFGVKAGGSIAHVEGVIKGFKKLGYSVDYIATDCPKSVQSSINQYFSLPIPKFISHIFSLNLCLFDDYICKNLKTINFKKYKFIYNRMSLNSISGIRLAHRLNLPLILEYNGSEVWVQRSWGKPLELEKISQSLENAALSCASYIVVVSKVLKQELVQKGIPPEKIIFYPNCVDPEKYDSDLFTKQELAQKRKSLGFSIQDIILTFVGTFGKWHGIEILAHAICSLCNTEPTWLQEKNVRFMLIGDGACMPEVKKILSSAPHYSNFVTLIGLVKQEETPLYLAMSDILISPHCSLNKNERFFGSPTKLFEYMAMKKIIIASDLEQIGEVLAPSVHIDNIEAINNTSLSILCNQGDIEGLVKAIKYAIDNLSTLCFMGRNARDKVLEMYTWDKHVGEILKKIQ